MSKKKKSMLAIREKALYNGGGKGKNFPNCVSKWGKEDGTVKEDEDRTGTKIRNNASTAVTVTRFMGSFAHSLDNKGRVVIPQGFREKLGEVFCIAPSFDFQSVAVYPSEKWEERNEAYEKLGKLNPAVNRYLEQFYALSYDGQSCDAQGRLLLPQNLRTKILQDERDVDVTGANDHVRIAVAVLEEKKWDSFREEMPQLLDMIASLEKPE